ncbi:MAG: hypothetical protein JST82_17435 [Bacteroidetes bacterium]|nr:hypothetical protein [Bacteroidota bacterium]
MKQTTRELLVTTKVAQNWQGDFEQKVEELITVVSKIDTDEQVVQASEVLDVYRTKNKRGRKGRKKKADQSDRPFEFLVFRN